MARYDWKWLDKYDYKWEMDKYDFKLEKNLWFTVKVISWEASEVSGAFAVPRQAVDHTLGRDIIEYYAQIFPSEKVLFTSDVIIFFRKKMHIFSFLGVFGCFWDVFNGFG